MSKKWWKKMNAIKYMTEVSQICAPVLQIFKNTAIYWGSDRLDSLSHNSAIEPTQIHILDGTLSHPINHSTCLSGIHYCNYQNFNSCCLGSATQSWDMLAVSCTPIFHNSGWKIWFYFNPSAHILTIFKYLRQDSRCNVGSLLVQRGCIGGQTKQNRV